MLKLRSQGFASRAAFKTVAKSYDRLRVLRREYCGFLSSCFGDLILVLVVHIFLRR
jgi:hypothetical protein